MKYRIVAENQLTRATALLAIVKSSPTKTVVELPGGGNHHLTIWHSRGIPDQFEHSKKGIAKNDSWASEKFKTALILFKNIKRATRHSEDYVSNRPLWGASPISINGIGMTLAESPLIICKQGDKIFSISGLAWESHTIYEFFLSDASDEAHYPLECPKWQIGIKAQPNTKVMHFLLTICSKTKSLQPEPLPAYLRYLSPRIAKLKEESDKSHVPALILSGKYGLLKIDDLVPYYDHPLPLSETDDLASKVSQQLHSLGATKITAYMKPRTTVGWEPYYAALEKATTLAGVKLNYHA